MVQKILDAYPDLLDQIKRRNCILFVGAGVSREIGLPGAEDLAATLAQDLGYATDSHQALSRVTQDYEVQRGRNRLIQRIQNMFDNVVLAPRQTSYDLIAGIDELNPIVTTNWDDHLEQSFQRKRKRISVIRYDAQITSLGQSRALIKLHGDFGNKPDEIVITRDDYTKTYQRVTKPGGLFAQLSVWLTTKTILFVGFSLQDDDFRLLYDYVREIFDANNANRHYAVMPHPSSTEVRYWDTRGITLIDTTAYPVLQEIFIATRNFINREKEREYIYQRAEKPYFQIYGFAGCGKTELAHQVFEQYRLDGVWRQAFVTLHENQAPLGVLAEIARLALNREIAPAEMLANARTSLAAENGIAPDALADDLVYPRALQLATDRLVEFIGQQKILLVFDGSEYVPPAVFQWLDANLVPALDAHVTDRMAQLRLIFSGRAPLTWTSPKIKRSVMDMPLSAFNETAVGGMLDYYVGLKLDSALPVPKRDLIIQNVLDISSGHPRAIRNLIAEIAEKNFDVSAEYFAHEQISLFRRNVLPIVTNQILGKIAPDLRPIVQTICVFRKMLPEFLDVLVRAKEIDPTYLPSLRLMGDLSATFLLGKPNPLYEIDVVVRRILAMAIEFENPARYETLHQLALDTFGQWRQGKSPTGESSESGSSSDELVVTYIVEALFHRVRLLALQKIIKPGDKIKTQLESDLKILGKKLADTTKFRIGTSLKNAIEQDQELLEQLASLLGDEAYTGLTTIVLAWK